MLRVLLLMAALLAGVSPAWGQTDAARERAKALFIEGRAHFAEGRLPQALTAFEQANAIKPHPLMLFNIAQVYEAMKDYPRAIETLRTFNTSDMADQESRNKQRFLEGAVAKWPRVSLSTSPAGAKVHVSDAKHPARCPATPCTIAVEPGRQTLIFAAPGFRPVSKTVRFSKGQAVTFPPVALPPIVGQVSFTTEPSGAKVLIDGQGRPGLTPFTQALRVGQHQAVITLDGHTPVSRQFVVTQQHSADAPLTVSATLQRGVALGQLAVEVDQPGAAILIDGKPIGTSPMSAPVPVSKGIHRLQVRAPGLDPYEEVVNVREGKLTQATVVLGAESGPGFSLTQSTVGYTLIGLGGAAILGGAVTGVMAVGANGDLDDCRGDASCRRTQREVDLADDVRSNALMTDILVGAGVAVAATGVVLWLLDDDTDAPTASAGPIFTITPTAGGAAAFGQVAF